MRLAVDATGVSAAGKGIARVQRGAAEALARRGDVVALVRPGTQLDAPSEAVRARPAVLWEQVGLARAARRHGLVLTFTERLPLFSGGRFVVWLFELPSRRIAANRRLGAGAYQRGSDLLTRASWRRSLRRAAAVLAGSAATAAELRTALPGLPDVRVVYPGLGSEFSPGEGPAGCPYVLHLGSSDPRDNTATVLEAFERVRARSAAPLRLLVAGGVQSQAAPGVDYLGRVPDAELIRLYRGATAFLDAALYEGFGYGPLEAMACGAPVVVSRAGSLPELIGDAGLLCDPRSSEAVAEALQRVLDEPGLSATLRERGLARAREFTWERRGAELAEALESVGR